jgi:hypothetical protein
MTKPPRTSAALEEERKIMAAYSDTAKTYTQLSLGALVLSVTFFEKVLGHSGRIPVDVFLLLAWVCWLVGVLAGAFYQYLAVRFLEARGEDWGLLRRGGHPQAFENLARHPWKVYAVLIVGFYLGAVFFGVVGILKLRLFS